jgi:secondary thiamine-phosphate synthase enzyme
MVDLQTITWMSTQPEQFYIITKQVHDIAEKSRIKNGMVLVVTAHTTTGIMVNEGLTCVETDIADTLDRIAPVDQAYVHAHFLPSYGATGNNSTGHIKSLICGNHCAFPLINGKIICGGAQDIYLVEFDGPQTRKVYVEIIGEE